MDRTKTLAEIRRKFIGSGEEHEALKSLVEDWQAAYQRGRDDAERDIQARNEADDYAIKLGRLYINGCPIDARLIELRGTERSREWMIDDIAIRLRVLGVTKEVLDEIGAALAAIPTAEPQP